MAKHEYEEVVEASGSGPNAMEAFASLANSFAMASPLALRQLGTGQMPVIQGQVQQQQYAIPQGQQYALPEPQQNGNQLPNNIKKRITIP